jgi:plasmid stabilization system protein ParE
MKFAVIIEPPAERDIRQTVSWWSEHRSTEQAKSWYERIYPAIATLAEQPDRCPVAAETDLVESGLRQMHFGIGRRATHRIVFTMTGSEVHILRIRHSAQQSLTLEDLS